jgi:hypothetical protein
MKSLSLYTHSLTQPHTEKDVLLKQLKKDELKRVERLSEQEKAASKQLMDRFSFRRLIWLSMKSRTR